MSKRFLIILLEIAAIVGIYYYVKHKLGERQAYIVNAVIGESFREDAVFIGSLMPIICQKDNKISYLITELLVQSSQADSVKLKKELNRLISNVPTRFSKAKAVNAWQKSLMQAIEPCIQDLKHIPVNADLSSPATQDIFNNISACVEANIQNNSALKVGIVSHFVNRILKNVTNNYNSVTDKFAVFLLGSGTILIEGRDALIIYDNLRKQFFNSPEFKEAYNNGCLKQLDEMTESLVMAYFLQFRDIQN